MNKFLRGAFAIGTSHALVVTSHAYSLSSELHFKTTDRRVVASDLENYVKDAQAAETIQSDAPVAGPKNSQRITPPLSVAQPALAAASANPTLKLQGALPARKANLAQIFVVQEESLLNGKIVPVANAQVSLIHPDLNVGAGIFTNPKGVARVPYPVSESVRFFVRAKGYVLGMGYATLGEMTVVPLVTEQRLSTLVKSLAIRLPAGQITVLGRLIDQNLKGLSNAKIRFSAMNPEVLYSGPFFGGIPGYFTRSFHQTDSTGAFIANGLSRTQQLIDVYHDEHSLPGYQFDLTGIPEGARFVSMALQSGPALNIETSVVDGDSFERPDCGLQTLVAANVNVFVPQDDGELWIEGNKRPNVNNIKVKPTCKGYVPTFLSQTSHATLFPPTIGMFSPKSINEMLTGLNRSWSPDETLVLGHIYPQKEFKHPSIRETIVTIIDAEGQKTDANISYFDKDNNLNARMTSTDAHYENFIVTGLDEGEYHFIYRDARTGLGHGMQVVRVRKGGVTQADY